MVRLADLEEGFATHLANMPMPHFDGEPWVDAPDVKDARVAIISTAGLHRASDRPFTGHANDYRIIPAAVDEGDLTMTHVSVNFDRSGFHRDVNVAFPLQHLHTLAAAGEIGSVADWHYSFMGATDPLRMEDTAADVARLLLDDGVTLALLIPV